MALPLPLQILGGVGSGYIQGLQQYQQRQQMEQMAAYRALLLQNAQRQREAATLAGQFLSQPPSGGGLPGSQAMPTAPSAVSPDAGPQPPMPGQPSVPATPPQPLAAPAAAAPGAPSGPAASVPPVGPQPGPTPTAGAAPAPPQQADQQTAAIAQIFHQQDPRTIAQQIRTARPDADPATITAATEMILKMGQSGNRMEQMYAMQLLREAGMEKRQGTGVSARADLETQREGAAAGRQQTSVGAAAARQQAGFAQQEKMQRERTAAISARTKATQDAIDRRFNASLKLRQMNAQDRQKAEAIKDAYKEIAAEIAALGTNITPEQGNQLAARAMQVWRSANAMGVTLPPPSQVIGTPGAGGTWNPPANSAPLPPQ